MTETTSTSRELISQARDHRETHGEGKGFRKRAAYHLTQAECDRLRKLCEVHDCTTAAAIVGCHVTSVYDARDRGWCSGHPGKPIKPVPTDFALYKDVMSKVALAEMYETTPRIVRRWIALSGGSTYRHQGRPSPRKMEPPADLAEVLARLGPMKACRHYGFHPSLLYKMRKRAGIPIPPSRRKRANDTSPGWVERYVQSEEYRRAA